MRSREEDVQDLKTQFTLMRRRGECDQNKTSTLICGG